MKVSARRHTAYHNHRSIADYTEAIRLDPTIARAYFNQIAVASVGVLVRHAEPCGILTTTITAERAVVFGDAWKLSAEGIVSKRINAQCRSGPHSTWIKLRNPASIAVQRERSEKWNK